MTGASPGRLPRHALILAFAIFVVGFGTNVSTPFLAEYRDRLDLGPSATMSIFVTYVFGILTALLVIGPLSDRWGRRPIVIPFTLLSAIASLIIIPGRNSFLLLLLGRVLLGVVSGAVLAIGAAWMQEIVGPGEEMRAAVWASVTGFIGFGAGPVISALFDWFEWSPLILPFFVHVALILCSLVMLVTVPETHQRPDPPPPFRIRIGVPAESRSDFFRIVVPPAMWVFAFPSTSFALFPVLIGESIPDRQVLIAAVSGVITAWSAVMSRPTLLRLGARRTLPLALAMGTVGYIFGTVGFASGWWGLLVPAAFCLGAASGMITGACLTLIGEMSSDAERGSLSSAFYFVAYTGMAMPLIVTSLTAIVGSTSTALLIITAAASVVTVLVWRTTAKLVPPAATGTHL